MEVRTDGGITFAETANLCRTYAGLKQDFEKTSAINLTPLRTLGRIHSRTRNVHRKRIRHENIPQP